MTLAIRLGIATLIFSVIGALGFFWLYPAPSFLGYYVATNASGSYRLHLVSDDSATMLFTDKRGKEYGYRGSLTPEPSGFHIVWTDKLDNGQWMPLAKPVQENLTLKNQEIHGEEGAFARIQK